VGIAAKEISTDCLNSGNMQKNTHQTLFFTSNFWGIFLNPLYLSRRHLFKTIKSNADFLTGKLLDFGCGNKPYKAFFTNVSEYTGLDYINEGHCHKDENIDVLYDGKEIPFPEEHFDSLLSTQVLEHVENLDFTLNEWYRVLKPNGRLLITVPFCGEEHELPHDYRRFTANGIEELLSDKGFRCLEIKKLGSSIEVINQLKISCLAKLFSTKLTPLRIFLKLFVLTPITIWALFWSWLLPKHQTLYFDILVLAQKTDKKHCQ
jgi:SAM-dependent methyltransferase